MKEDNQKKNEMVTRCFKSAFVFELVFWTGEVVGGDAFNTSSNFLLKLCSVQKLIDFLLRSNHKHVSKLQIYLPLLSSRLINSVHL